ncbi:hypothetical protein FYJ43_00770 [Cutibacterium sp. WCA-380-WT-3A]|uniref:Uncharacterized protein n=1 Tax=Cutibacterium porci TaxID=2605781 RepID=A0A7K0J3W2_9ACTN|nr:hypothetical protein [Cutibacterium porci]
MAATWTFHPYVIPGGWGGRWICHGPSTVDVHPGASAGITEMSPVRQGECGAQGTSYHVGLAKVNGMWDFMAGLFECSDASVSAG